MQNDSILGRVEVGRATSAQRRCCCMKTSGGMVYQLARRSTPLGMLLLPTVLIAPARLLMGSYCAVELLLQLLYSEGPTNRSANQLISSFSELIVFIFLLATAAPLCALMHVTLSQWR